ncbi:MAG: hypothetical protein IJY27_01175 [Clostridia bacterium]|nr:hypothetical protein [Clostridia bacterium]
MYYGLIILSVTMFGACFALQDVYRKMRGSGISISLESSLVGAVAGLVVLLAINGFHFELTPFTLFMASLAALNSIAFTFCSFKALDVINLSLFSLFSMLGGMALPFVQGIVFYNEKITLAKIVCFVFVCIALLMTVSRSEKKRGVIYYIGIFVLNGMSGVLSKIFTSAPFEKTGAAWYSIWGAVFTIIFAGAALVFMHGKQGSAKPYTLRAFFVSAAGGGVNKIANFLLIIALAHVDASVQYPMVTGGVMIVSALISFFGDRKPSKKEILSILFAFLGMLALFIIPI